MQGAARHRAGVALQDEGCSESSGVHQEAIGKNVFDSEKHKIPTKQLTKDGELKVDHLIKPFELRLFELRKKAYTIQLTRAEMAEMENYEIRYQRDKAVFESGDAP